MAHHLNDFFAEQIGLLLAADDTLETQVPGQYAEDTRHDAMATLLGAILDSDGGLRDPIVWEALESVTTEFFGGE